MDKITTVQALKQMPEDDYMNDTQLEYFKDVLVQLKEDTLNEIKLCKDDITQANREPDVVDIAAIEDERARKLRFVDRKLKFVRKIDSSLNRIQKKDYGYCDETGNPIGIERLLLRPTATLSIEAKKMQEAREVHFREYD